MEADMDMVSEGLHGNGLSGALLPIHFKPKENELLSSWICRLALAHGLDYSGFCSAVIPHRLTRQLFRNLDIDSSAGRESLTVLAEKTSTPVERVACTTLTAYEGFLFERWNLIVPQQLTMPVTRWPRDLKYGLQYCPLCLATEEPYYRRTWRLAFVTLCTKHRVQLSDRCARCTSPISFLRAISNGRHAPPSDRIEFCCSCKADLRDVRYESAGSTNSPSDDEILFQECLEKALREGWIELPGSGVGYSLHYFPVLHQLTRLLAVGELGTNLRESLSRQYGIRMFSVTFTKNKCDLAQLSVGERRGLLEMARRLLTNWPNEFINFCTVNRIPRRYLLSRCGRLPFWFWSVVNEQTSHSLYEAPRDEIESAILCLQKMRRQYLRGPNFYPKEMKVVKEFLSTSSPRYRKLLKTYRIRQASKGNKQIRPRRISEVLWKKLEIIINARSKRFTLPSNERRQYLDGILYVLHTRCSWKEMPAKFGSHMHARGMYYYWKRAGIFDQIWQFCSHLYDD